jgi:hypothetical protein
MTTEPSGTVTDDAGKVMEEREFLQIGLETMPDG